MEFLATRLGDRLTWVDHHVNMVKVSEASDILRKVPGIRSIGESERKPLCGAELTWEFLYPRKAMPAILRWIGEWDTWRGMGGERFAEVWAFQEGMYDLQKRPAEFFGWWHQMFTTYSGQGGEDFIQERIVATGRPKVEFMRKKNRSLLYTQGFEATLATPDRAYDVLAVNSNGGSLTFIDYYNPKRHDAMLKFFFTDLDRVSVGLYSDGPERMNCSEVCQALGQSGPIPSGGGHTGAGGFQTTWDHFRTLLKAPTTLKVLGKKIRYPR
jgi:hypothetical protein